ncbi:LysR family transcriptional regulator [Alishewanella sp. 16-MA]|uniref:LysR family transcriptional regulator n=1 Tax=Alishewanella maricola TaxID=2795740 RepID=A0ABS8C595_9ALTE|nr:MULTISPECIES: LysR substrate-binding domain-containing protein [Gammaproteobacteria]MDP4945658.1 LysR substrate-binding domain-containing protein [Alishewanella sp.]MDP5205697.1 LysR substrate-binding domain-containing protein [Alishewanella sp. SMS9]MCB5227308.1 LysR family transcriptional regulator [Alishewanella maricola]MCC5452210.1 LysR family transcriptional regulator [Rheinheimera sp. UJ51]MCF4010767.1 LysR substrate-binding domain-containing protein [Rheinheimera sp. UJ63]
MSLQTPLRGLRCFCVAAECLSFKDTAKQLYLTPSAVSHQIKQLEDNLNLSLFERKTRAIELTETGKQFYLEIKPLLEQLSQTITQFSQVERVREVSISMPEFFASELFVPRLRGWSEQFPNINLKLETVKSRRENTKYTDVSVVLSGKKPEDASVYDLFPISYLPACNPALFQKLHNKGYRVLEKTPLILHQARPTAWHQWAERVGYHQFQPKQIIQLDSMFSVARAAQQGLGVALIPMPISHAWFTGGSLVKLFEQELVSRDRYYLVQHNDDTDRPEIKLLIDWILKSFHTADFSLPAMTK